MDTQLTFQMLKKTKGMPLTINDKEQVCPVIWAGIRGNKMVCVLLLSQDGACMTASIPAGDYPNLPEIDYPA